MSTRRILFGLVFAASALLTGCLETPSPPSPPSPPPPPDNGDRPGTPPVDCGNPAAWDGDGDGLSDAVERNTAT